MAIVARLEGGGFIIGLEEGNIERLKEGRPFHKNLAEFGGPLCDIFIVYGENQSAIMRQLEGMATADTQVIDQTKKEKH